MESAAKRRLGDIFVERGLISEEQLEEALTVQRDTGTKLGEALVELGFVTRVALAGVIAEQWDEAGVTARGRKTSGVTRVVDSELHQRIEVLTAELAARDHRIAQQDATISLLISKLGSAAA